MLFSLGATLLLFSLGVVGWTSLQLMFLNLWPLLLMMVGFFVIGGALHAPWWTLLAGLCFVAFCVSGVLWFSCRAERPHRAHVALRPRVRLPLRSEHCGCSLALALASALRQPWLCSKDERPPRMHNHLASAAFLFVKANKTWRPSPHFFAYAGSHGLKYTSTKQHIAPSAAITPYNLLRCHRFGGVVVRCSLKGNRGLTDRRYKQRKSSIVAKIAAVGCASIVLAGCIGFGIASAGGSAQEVDAFGIDAMSGQMRMTFGTTYLLGGLSFVPVLIGLFAFSQVLASIEDSYNETYVKHDVKLKRVFPTIADLKECAVTILRSSIIGTVIGAVPGTGGDISSFISYNEAKRWSKHKEKFGDGAPEGICAPEAGNNAVSGGAMIPLLTLGIPGDSVTAIMLGALMMQGIYTWTAAFSAPRRWMSTPSLSLCLWPTSSCACWLWCYPHLLQNQPGTYEVAEPHCVCLLCGRHLCHQ